MITLHHLNNSRSQRIIWLLEELGVDYQIKKYERDSETMLAPDELKEIHPLGKSPVITVGDNTIAESGTIVEYLIDNYGQEKFLNPQNGSKKYEVSYWSHFSEGSLMPPFLLKLIFEKIKSQKLPFFVKPIANKIADKVLESFVMPNVFRHMNFIEKHLENKEFFVGEQISAADIMMIFPLEAALTRIDGKSFKNIERYVKSIHDLDTYKLALKKGGEYVYA